MVEWKVFLSTFLMIFLAEMGDKTQLAALTMSARTHSPLTVLSGACLALILATILGVFFGSTIAQWIPPSVLRKAAAGFFILIGGVMLLGGR